MISSFLQRFLSIFYCANRTAVDAGDTLYTGVRPNRLSLFQCDRPSRTNPFAQATRNASIRHPERVPPDRQMGKERIDQIGFQSGHAPFMVQGLFGMLPDSINYLAHTIRRVVQLLRFHLFAIHIESRQQDVVVRHDHGISGCKR